MITAWLTISGLSADIVGFGLIGWGLLTPPDDKPFWSTPKSYNQERIGFVLVILGFALQAVAQGFVLLNG